MKLRGALYEISKVCCCFCSIRTICFQEKLVSISHTIVKHGGMVFIDELPKDFTSDQPQDCQIDPQKLNIPQNTEFLVGSQ